MADLPLVSVVIPVYNAEQFLPATLRSVFHQTYRPIEVIVVADGCTDDSAAIARSFEGVTVESQPRRGASAARNRGFERAHADLVTFIDSDDEMTRGGLSAEVAHIESHQNVGCVFGRSAIRLEPGLERPSWVQAPLGHDDPVPMASALFRASLLKEAGGFDEGRRFGEWFDLLTRLRDHGLEVAVIDEPVLRYRIHGANQSDQREFQSGMFSSLKRKLDRQRAFRDGTS